MGGSGEEEAVGGRGRVEDVLAAALEADDGPDGEGEARGAAVLRVAFGGGDVAAVGRVGVGHLGRQVVGDAVEGEGLGPGLVSREEAEELGGDGDRARAGGVEAPQEFVELEPDVGFLRRSRGDFQLEVSCNTSRGEIQHKYNTIRGELQR